MTDTGRPSITSARDGVGHAGTVIQKGALGLALPRRLGARTATR